MLLLILAPVYDCPCAPPCKMIREGLLWWRECFIASFVEVPEEVV